jgi:hypothetical protein
MLSDGGIVKSRIKSTARASRFGLAEYLRFIADFLHLCGIVLVGFIVIFSRVSFSLGIGAILCLNLFRFIIAMLVCGGCERNRCNTPSDKTVVAANDPLLSGAASTVGNAAAGVA